MFLDSPEKREADRCAQVHASSCPCHRLTMAHRYEGRGLRPITFPSDVIIPQRLFITIHPSFTKSNRRWDPPPETSSLSMQPWGFHTEVAHPSGDHYRGGRGDSVSRNMSIYKFWRDKPRAISQK